MKIKLKSITKIDKILIPIFIFGYTFIMNIFFGVTFDGANLISGGVDDFYSALVDLVSGGSYELATVLYAAILTPIFGLIFLFITFKLSTYMSEKIRKFLYCYGITFTLAAVLINVFFAIQEYVIQGLSDELILYVALFWFAIGLIIALVSHIKAYVQMIKTK